MVVSIGDLGRLHPASKLAETPPLPQARSERAFSSQGQLMAELGYARHASAFTMQTKSEPHRFRKGKERAACGLPFSRTVVMG